MRGLVVFEGRRFLTPAAPNSTIWYANIGEADQVGLMVDSSQQGQYDNSDQGALFFDAIEDFTLGSIKMYAQSLSAKNIEIRDSADHVLHSKLAFLSAGENEVELNFDIQAGKGLAISFSGIGELYEQAGDINYPYQTDWAEITGSSRGDSVYNFFFGYNHGTRPIELTKWALLSLCKVRKRDLESETD